MINALIAISCKDLYILYQCDTASKDDDEDEILEDFVLGDFVHRLSELHPPLPAGRLKIS